MSTRIALLMPLHQGSVTHAVLRGGMIGATVCFAAAATGAVTPTDQEISTLTPATSIKALVAKTPESPNSSTPIKSNSKPNWHELTAAQQISLKPLSANWSSLGEAQKRKWIAIATSYPKLSNAEQVKLHSRMTDWAALSQHQRAQARLNFAETILATPSQKTATWQAYQALSPAEKKKLGSLSSTKGSGVAAVARPVSPQKLVTSPLSRPSPKQGLKMAAAKSAVDQNTLLPSPADPAVLPKN